MAFVGAAGAQGRTDVIAGTVNTETGLPVLGASVIVTRAPDRVFLSTRSDESGRFQVVFAEGTGDYLVFVSAPDRQAFRRRLVQENRADTLFRVEVTLPRYVTVLEEVAIVAEQRVPRRADVNGYETGSQQTTVDGVVGAVNPEDEGNPEALAELVPGVVVGSAGLSVLGLDPSQSRLTLDGLSYVGGEIPRGIAPRVRVISSVYDPAKGAFSGGEVAIEVPAGTIFTRARSFLAVTPNLPYRASATEASPGAYAVQGSQQRSGRLGSSPFFFNGGLQLRQTAVQLNTIDRTGRLLDELTTAADLARSLGFPPTATHREHAYNRSAVGIVRIDHSPASDTSGLVPRTLAGLGYFNISTRDIPRSVASLNSLPESAQEGVARFQGLHSAYTSPRALWETRGALTYSRFRTAPTVAFPSVEVLLRGVSSDPDSPHLVPAEIGGSGSGHSRDTRVVAEVRSTFETIPAWAPGHGLKLAFNGRYETVEQRDASSMFGHFQFGSLADLRDGVPIRYTRLLHAAERDERYWDLGASIGDLWKGRNVEVLYGVRADISGLEVRGLEDGGIGSSRVPSLSSVGVSPRLGFTWLYRKRERSRPSLSASDLGTVYRNQRSAIKGGIGAFRGVFSPRLVDAMAARLSTGDRLECVGDEMAVPVWPAFATESTLPGICQQTQVGQVARNTGGLSRTVEPPVSWRGNLRWETSTGAIDLALEGVYSITSNEVRSRDSNLSPSKFSISREAGRSVYALPAEIDPGSGVAPLRASRVDQGLAHAWVVTSTGKTVSRQLTLTASPRLDIGRRFVRASYTLADARTRLNSFDGSSGREAGADEWAPSAFDFRHQVLVQAGVRGSAVVATLSLRALSGAPFTPLIDRDVNADGLANDRAFVFSPADDPSLGNQLRDLIDRSPRNIAHCLQRAEGAIPQHNSCRSAWSASSNLRIGLVPGELVSRRVNAALNVGNLLALLDHALHRTPRGWGLPRRPETHLLRVTGFEAPETFLYAVNPRFGRQATVAQRFPAYRVTLDVSVDLAPSRSVQQVNRWLRPGRQGRPGARLSAADLKRRYSQTVPDLYQAILAETDSLLLIREQVDSLRVRQARYQATVDPVWDTLSRQLAELPDRFDLRIALAAQEMATDSVWEIARLEAQKLAEILTPGQLGVLPWPADVLFAAKQRRRFGSYPVP